MAPLDGSPLATELAAHAARHPAQATIKLEVIFPGGFPMEPPFVRVVTPRFACAARSRPLRPLALACAFTLTMPRCRRH